MNTHTNIRKKQKLYTPYTPIYFVYRGYNHPNSRIQFAQVTVIDGYSLSGMNGPFRSNRVISFKYQVLCTHLKSLIYKGFCGTKPRRLDDFLVPDVSVKRFLRLFSLSGICRVTFVCILVMLVYVLVSAVLFFGFSIPS